MTKLAHFVFRFYFCYKFTLIFFTIFEWISANLTIYFIKNLNNIAISSTKNQLACYLSGESHLSPLDFKTGLDSFPSSGFSLIWYAYFHVIDRGSAYEARIDFSCYYCNLDDVHVLNLNQR